MAKIVTFKVICQMIPIWVRGQLALGPAAGTQLPARRPLRRAARPRRRRCAGRRGRVQEDAGG